MAATDEEIKARIDKITDRKKCEQMGTNILSKQGESELFHYANYRASLLRKREFELAGRRPDIDYHILGLRNGDEIYLPDTDFVAFVFSHRTLLCQGREVYITPLETDLMERLPRKLVAHQWRVRATDERIDELYNKIYPRSETDSA